MNEAFFQALANPYRREIIRLLRFRNLTVGEIVEHFDIAQPSISRHLDVLKKAEIVCCERRGPQMVYSLDLSAVQEMLLYTAELFSGEGREAHGKEQTAP